MWWGRMNAFCVFKHVRMLRISWSECVRNNEVLERMQTWMSLLLNITKRKLKFLEPDMRKEGLKNLVLTGRVEEKRQGKATHHIPGRLLPVDGRT